MVLTIGLLMFAAVTLGALTLVRPRRYLAGARMRAGGITQTATASRFDTGPTRRPFAPSIVGMGRIIVRLLPTNLVSHVTRTLGTANSPLSPVGFFSLWCASAVVGLGSVAAVVRLSSHLSPVHLALLSTLVAAPFVVGPYALLRRRATRRRRQVRRDLPDALDLLVTAVEAGLGVDAAIALIAERTTGPLAESFVLYLRQVGLGSARRDALLQVAARTDVDDFIRLAASVAQAEQVGTSLGDVLRQQADDVRQLRWQRAREAAQKAPVWMTIPLALCFLPAMVAVIIVPSVINLISFVSTLGAR